ncbi:hypothetical protein [Streptomyces hydrogenans]|uniref:hypothetical protein n=1 Tax=Streptomyces hydrogenans TaxID=1873719 RepID=UPI0035D87AB4
MRSDYAAEFVATRPYENRCEMDHALYAHARRVMAARREDPNGELAAQPVLTVSGMTVMSAEAAECGIGTHTVGGVFHATAETHRIENRNGEPCQAWLCVRHWSEYARTEEDDPDAPAAEIRFGRA